MLCIQVLAKAPSTPKIKTRLQPVLGLTATRQLYAQLLWHTLELASHCAPVQLWCAPHTDFAFFKHCQQHFGLTLHAQCAGDLGDRMHFALTQALKTHHLPVLIGSDSFTLSAHDIHQAFAHLSAGTPAVFAPSVDGGYALVGVNQAMPEIFLHQQWSHPQVMAEARLNLQAKGIQWAELNKQADLDTPQDWLEYLRFTAFT